MNYPVYWNEKEVGRADVNRQGLFYVFHCRVNPPKGELYRLQVVSKGQITDLGICVPEGADYVLTKRVSLKSIGEGKWEFQLTANNRKEQFIPIIQGQPFVYLQELEKGKFHIQNGMSGIVINANPLPLHKI